MRHVPTATSWVIYQMGKRTEKSLGGNVVCSQEEWTELEAAEPGFHALVRGGFATENEAERAARGTAGDGRKTGWAKK